MYSGFDAAKVAIRHSSETFKNILELFSMSNMIGWRIDIGSPILLVFQFDCDIGFVLIGDCI